MNYNWNSINVLDGSRAKAFEELCAQLARAKSPDKATFRRKGTPDAGVECYCTLPDGREWGWQAKYFDTLGASQWQQLDDSIKTAIEKHPSLVRYFICVPYDRPDARASGQKSAMQRWDEHVEKWKRWTQEREMDVEFVWWGSSELWDLLSGSEHIGRLYFWFEKRRFDEAWFQARFNEARDTAGPRYTPEIHVDLPIAHDLATFGRSESLFHKISSFARRIRRELGYVTGPNSSEEEVRLDDLPQAGHALVKGLSAVKPMPIGTLPFSSITDAVRKVEKKAAEIEKTLSEKIYSSSAQSAEDENRAAYQRRIHPFVQQRERIHRLQSELRQAHDILSNADKIASSRVLILKGEAGMGKTHLLCDVAKQRIMDGVPTVLLMGQRFTGADDPWSQALRQLDLSASAEQFVGALEAAAQIANRRALVIIDAINESADRKLWPSHLATFLARLKRSPWIGIVLSVRSAYLENLIPENVRDGAVIVEHRGFADHEYDAGRTFFSHYGLEFSSVPIMHPEFRNPLFLKTLCKGLQGEGLRTIPRGFEGITAIFERYLLAVNKQLAESCDYDPTSNLVGEALKNIVQHMIKTGKHWFPRSKAKTAVDGLLPERGFERSLYRGLVVEGVLIEQRDPHTDDEEVVLISYERLADHIIGDLLLRTHLKAEMPEAAFREGGGLAFLCDEERYVSPGLIEAFCIQIPERVGKELVRLAPTLTDHWHIGDAFRQSIVWRKPDAFSDQTQAVMNELIRNEGDYVDTLDALLTVASANDHPFNAEFLDRWLRRDFMPDRDAQWSIYLRYLWKDQSAVDRLIDWASSLSSTDNIDSRSVELCSIALAWMLSSPHRFLRDRATKALVSLLTGRPHAAARLVERFFDVDDLYVVERVYAVAYGVAMRSSDPAAVGSLAARVYEKAFASGKPPIHILARDYARGIIERAIHLGSELALNEQLIRPPYQSAWPKIPNEDEIQPLLRSRNTQSPNDGDPHGEWAKNRIGYSVMTWDFARYVIGTNFWSPNWLSLRLDEDPWCSPDKRIEALLPTLSKPERSAWETYSKAGDAVRSLRSLSLLKLLEESSAGPDNAESEPAAVTAHELEQAEQARDEALGELLSVLTPDHRTEIESILRVRDENVSAPRFDLKLIQRYVLSRVFDLGWTTDRFGEHDYSVSHADRGGTSKPERTGKKYQWIAYHEILAYIADHYQYRPDLSQEDSDRTYEGPWQESLRNIDPSSTLPATPGGTSFEGHTSSWWTQCSYSAWDRGVSHSEWVSRNNDIPDTKDLLIVTHPEETGRWLIADGDFFWREDTPTNVEPTEVALRELSLSYSGHFIRKNDLSAFKKWAQGVDFYGHWMPDTPGSYNLFLGEYGWSPAFAYLQRQDEDGDDWITPERNCPVSIRSAAYQYHSESGDFDCSVDRSYTLQLPHHEFIETLKLKWAGSGAHYLDQHGKRAAFDPTAYEDGPTALLLREDLLKEYLADKELVFCWIVVGGKRVIGPARGREYHGEQRISGAIYYTEHGLEDLVSSKYYSSADLAPKGNLPT